MQVEDGMAKRGPRGAKGDPGPLGATLRSRRDALGLSQEALAEAAKLSTTYVAMLERGERRNPGLRALRALADALGCSVEDLSAGPVDVSPALDRFLESELGAGITAEERQKLIEMERVLGAPLTQAGYVRALDLLRGERGKK